MTPAAIIRDGTGVPIAGEVAVVADLRQAAWDGRLTLSDADHGAAGSADGPFAS